MVIESMRKDKVVKEIAKFLLCRNGLSLLGPA